MADQLSQVFAALADPTRRDIVARLTTPTPRSPSWRAVRRQRAGGLQAPQGARGRRLVTRSRDAQRRPVHLEAEVFDLMTKWIERYRRAGRGALPAAGRRAGRDERRPDRPTTDQRKEQHHEHHDRTTRGRHRGRPDLPTIHITRDFRATPEQLIRAHTDPELFAQWIGPDASSARIDHWDARTGGSFRYVADARRRGVRVPRLLPRGRTTASCRPSPGRACPRRRAGDHDLRGPRRRPHPAARPVAVRLFEARDGWLSSGMEVGVNEGYAKLDDLVAAGGV